MNQILIQRIEQRSATIGVVGLGYVGLPLLLEFAKADFNVIGFDTDDKKVSSLNNGSSYIGHIPDQSIASMLMDNDKAIATSDFRQIADCDATIICVPTPLTKHRDPDLSYIESTARSIAPHIKKGHLVILESTTYPGTTEEVVAPILEEISGMVAGKDFLLAYSPEREDPNNKQFSTATIPKVVGGVSEESLNAATALYEAVICKVVPVANCRTAEATKLMENIFRCINIALVNELKIIFEAMDIDVWDVIEAASTKPFGFMPFYPGPGLGGHCIPIDPFYLAWKAKETGVPTRFIELAGEINTNMPRYVITKTMVALNDRGKSLKGCRVLIVGLAYKKNVDDDRESPAYALWEELLKYGASVSYYDPHCPVVGHLREHKDFAGVESISFEDIKANNYDVAIIATAHDAVDHNKLAQLLPLVIDTRGICTPAENVVKA